MNRLPLPSLLMLALSFCADDNLQSGRSVTYDTEGNPVVTEPVSNPKPGTTPAVLLPATGLKITEVSVYQTVKIPIMENFQEITSRAAPIISNKELFMRIFFETLPGWKAREVKARLHLENSSGQTKKLQSQAYVEFSSTEGNIAGTLNFELEANWITPDLTYFVELLEVSPETDIPGDSTYSAWPTKGTMSPFNAVIPQKLKVVFVPVQYNADGTGRLPDLSPNQLALYEEYLYTRYPASDINITVRETVQWDNEISPNGQGWNGILNALQNLRSRDNVDDKTYYYAVMAPASSFEAFCRRGCIAGVSPVIQDYRWGSARIGLGLGFSGKDSASTMLHALGHTHGREHAPCGLGGQESDRYYPNTNASLDNWGFGLSDYRLMAPNQFKDIMGYCDPTWVSTYTYNALFQRISNVNTLNRIMTPKDGDISEPWAALVKEASGDLEWGFPVRIGMMKGAEIVNVRYLDDHGAEHSRSEGFFLPYEHTHGGAFYFARPAAKNIHRVEVEGEIFDFRDEPKYAFETFPKDALNNQRIK